MALTLRPGQIRGYVQRVNDWSAILVDDDGVEYFMFYNALDSFGVTIDQLHVLDPVVFTPIEDSHGQREFGGVQWRAIEVRVEKLPPRVVE